MKPFYEQPILNSPYFPPTRHHALGDDGRPLEAEPLGGRRKSRYIVPVPGSRRRGPAAQAELELEEADDTGRYSENAVVNEIRTYVESWRGLPDPNDWGVTPTTARLLQHWRSYNFTGARPFFCQVEAVETVIWLTEVARGRKQYANLFRGLEQANAEANPDLYRLALKLATGADAFSWPLIPVTSCSIPPAARAPRRCCVLAGTAGSRFPMGVRSESLTLNPDCSPAGYHRVFRRHCGCDSLTRRRP